MAPILIISYYFPPSSKVGGRRWAKFAKYLQKENRHTIHILTINHPDKLGLWDDDIKNIKHIYKITLPAKPYFKRPIEKKLSIWEYFRFKCSCFYYSFLKSTIKGDPDDLASNIQEQITKKTTYIVKQYGIKNIIVTGAPFKLCYYTALVKQKYFPDINLIVDYRDFWIDGSSYNQLSARRKKQELKMETLVVQQADIILTVNNLIAKKIKKYHPGNDHKIKLLPHAYDKEDFLAVSPSVSVPSSPIIFMYAGTLYPHMEKTILKLCRLIQSIIAYNQNVLVKFYTFDQSYYDLLKREGILKYTIYEKPLPPKKLFHEMSNGHILLQMRANIVLEENFKSSKFYELLNLRRPLLYVGDKSELSEFITTNKLGYALTNLKEINDISTQIIKNIQSDQIPDKSYNLDQYSFDNQLKTLNSLFV